MYAGLFADASVRGGGGGRGEGRVSGRFKGICGIVKYVLSISIP